MWLHAIGARHHPSGHHCLAGCGRGAGGGRRSRTVDLVELQRFGGEVALKETVLAGGMMRTPDRVEPGPLPTAELKSFLILQEMFLQMKLILLSMKH